MILDIHLQVIHYSQTVFPYAPSVLVVLSLVRKRSVYMLFMQQAPSSCQAQHPRGATFNMHTRCVVTVHVHVPFNDCLVSTAATRQSSRRYLRTSGLQISYSKLVFIAFFVWQRTPFVPSFLDSVTTFDKLVITFYRPSDHVLSIPNRPGASNMRAILRH